MRAQLQGLDTLGVSVRLLMSLFMCLCWFCGGFGHAGRGSAHFLSLPVSSSVTVSSCVSSCVLPCIALCFSLCASLYVLLIFVQLQACHATEETICSPAHVVSFFFVSLFNLFRLIFWGPCLYVYKYMWLQFCSHACHDETGLAKHDSDRPTDVWATPKVFHANSASDQSAEDRKITRDVSAVSGPRWTSYCCSYRDV